MKRVFAILTLVFAVLIASMPSAFAAVPTPSGSTPVSGKPTAFGAFTGEDAGDIAPCKVGGKNLLIVSGDVNAYTDMQGSKRNAARLAIVDASSAKLYWAASNVSGQTVTDKSGRPYDNGFIQTVHCQPRTASTADLYVGGNFTTFLGQPRQRTAMVTISVSGDSVKVALKPWQLKAFSQVWHIGPVSNRIGVAGGSRFWLTDPVSAATLCQVSGDRSVRSFVYARGSVYLGGLFDTLSGDGVTRKARGVGKVKAANCRPQPYRATLPRNKPGTYSGSNALSLVYDSKRDNIVTANGGMRNTITSFNRVTGRQKWGREISGDGQVALIYGDRLFVGWHVSGGKVPDKRGCYKKVCGGHGGFFSLKNGKQVKWLRLPAGDFAGGGRNHDGRNNGISGATIVSGYLFVSGSISKIGTLKAGHVARFKTS